MHDRIMVESILMDEWLVKGSYVVWSDNVYAMTVEEQMLMGEPCYLGELLSIVHSLLLLETDRSL